MYTVNNKREYGNADHTIQLLKCRPHHTAIKTMQQRKQNGLLRIILLTVYQQHNTIIDEQKVNDLNPLYTLAIVTYDDD
jgi:hypothetical protein